MQGKGGDNANYDIANNTAGQKTEAVTDDSLSALLFFIIGCLVLGAGLFFVIRCACNADSYVRNAVKRRPTLKKQPNKEDDIEANKQVILSPRELKEKIGAAIIARNKADKLKDAARENGAEDSLRNNSIRELLDGTTAVTIPPRGLALAAQESHPPQQVGAKSVKPLVGGLDESRHEIGSKDFVDNGIND